MLIRHIQILVWIFGPPQSSDNFSQILEVLLSKRAPILRMQPAELEYVLHYFVLT